MRINPYKNTAKCRIIYEISIPKYVFFDAQTCIAFHNQSAINYFISYFI